MIMNIHEYADSRGFYLTIYRYVQSKTWAFEIHDRSLPEDEDKIKTVEGSPYQRAENSCRKEMDEMYGLRHPKEAK